MSPAEASSGETAAKVAAKAAANAVSNGHAAHALAGRRVVVTRAIEQAGELIALLEAAGAEALVFPCIAIAEPESWDAADAAIGRLRAAAAPAYDWVLFTSANGVGCFFDRCAVRGVDAASVAALRVAAVGPATAAALAARGIEPEVLPEEYVGESLLEALIARGVGAGSRVLLPRAEEARDVLPDGLRARGAQVDIVPVYRTVTGPGDAAVLERLSAGEADAVTFTSPSTVRGFLRLTGGMLTPMPVVACIGPVASAAARSNGLEVAAEPAEHTVSGLVRALDAHFLD